MISHMGCNAEAESLRLQRAAAEAALKKAEEENERLRAVIEDGSCFTDACIVNRAKAAEARVAEMERRYDRLTLDVKRLSDRAAVLEKALRDAPHGRGCQAISPHSILPCVCWKAAAALEKKA
jgi:hypothetical protein